MMKQAADLSPLEFAVHPVWEFAPEGEGIDECSMIPVVNLPVDTLDQRCIGTQVVLANGSSVWAVIYDLWPLALEGTIKSQKFQFFEGSRSCGWPADEHQDGTVDSAALAAFLGLRVDDVFPFTYDVSDFVVGDIATTKRSVSREEETKKHWTESLDPALVESFLKSMNK